MIDSSMFRTKALLIPALLAILSPCPALAETDYYAPFPFGTGTSYARDADETVIAKVNF